MLRDKIDAPGRACPDCPARQAGVLEHLLPNRNHGCALRVATVGERETIPYTWFGRYALGLVRRGIVIRQRVDENGVATAVDVIGAGSALLLDDENGNVSGYAVTEAMLCLCPRGTVAEASCGAMPTPSDIIRLQAAALERMDRLADARNRSNARARVSAMLSTLADVLVRHHRLDVIPAQLQRRDFAALLALRHESVSRALADLERAGVVTRTREGLALTRHVTNVMSSPECAEHPDAESRS